MSDNPVYGYRYERVLVPVSSALDIGFPYVTITLSPEQTAMVRAMCEYLGRRDTYVDVYQASSYQGPDDDDWDKIQATVAELEHSLMGNDNTIFGVNERWLESCGEVGVGAGTWIGYSDVVPAGEVWVLQGAHIRNFSGDRGAVYIAVGDGTDWQFLHVDDNAKEDWPSIWCGTIVLEQGDKVRFLQTSVLSGDTIEAVCVGYKMVV